MNALPLSHRAFVFTDVLNLTTVRKTESRSQCFRAMYFDSYQTKYNISLKIFFHSHSLCTKLEWAKMCVKYALLEAHCHTIDKKLQFFQTPIILGS